MSYYSILNLDPLSSMTEIKNAYDKIKLSITDNDKINEIEKAYQTLSNYHSRRMYDNQSENSNIVKDVIASNEETGNEFFLNEKNDNFQQIENGDNFSNNNLFSSRNYKENFDSQMINLNQRLEQIEKKIDLGKKTNFYREKRFIKETVKNGKKIITIDFFINDNGYKSKSSKVIEFDEQGKKKTYYLKNKNSKRYDDI